MCVREQASGAACTSSFYFEPPVAVRSSAVPSKLKGTFEYFVSPYELNVLQGFVSPTYFFNGMARKVVENVGYLGPGVALLVRNPGIVVLLFLCMSCPDAPLPCCSVSPLLPLVIRPRRWQCIAELLMAPVLQFGTYGYATEFKRAEDMHHRY